MLSIHLHSHKLITRRSITRNFRVHSIQLKPNTSTKYSAVMLQIKKRFSYLNICKNRLSLHFIDTVAFSLDFMQFSNFLFKRLKVHNDISLVNYYFCVIYGIKAFQSKSFWENPVHNVLQDLETYLIH